jgi:OOP family OmpA-OmpF porin
MSTRPASIALALLLGGIAAGASAQSMKDAYIQDGRGEIARNSNFGDLKIGNLCWRTGYWSPARSIAECDPDIAPRPMAPPPPAAVMQPPAPSPPPAKKVCDFTMTLDNDATFDFNKAVLKPSAKAELDQKVVARAADSCAKIDLLLITGHTDRIGSQQYNQKLSEKRGNAVAAYLQSKGMTVSEVLGAGKTLPIKHCDDNLGMQALEACLAPNRRVVVEVKGPAK